MPEDLYVLLPYKKLEALLAAVSALESMRKDIKICNEQIALLRQIQTEGFEIFEGKIRELHRMI